MLSGVTFIMVAAGVVLTFTPAIEAGENVFEIPMDISGLTDEELTEYVKNLRDSLKKTITELAVNTFQISKFSVLTGGHYKIKCDRSEGNVTNIGVKFHNTRRTHRGKLLTIDLKVEKDPSTSKNSFNIFDNFWVIVYEITASDTDGSEAMKASFEGECKFAITLRFDSGKLTARPMYVFDSDRVDEAVFTEDNRNQNCQIDYGSKLILNQNTCAKLHARLIKKAVDLEGIPNQGSMSE